MRARLKSGVFNARDRQYNPGDIIDDIEKVPVMFRDMWEELPPRRRPAPVEIKKQEEPKVEVKEEPAAKEEKPKTKKPSTTSKRTSTKRRTSSRTKK